MTDQKIWSTMTLADIDAYYGGLLREIQELQELLKTKEKINGEQRKEKSHKGA
jgi:hypothetical protein